MLKIINGIKINTVTCTVTKTDILRYPMEVLYTKREMPKDRLHRAIHGVVQISAAIVEICVIGVIHCDTGM